jgi:splicing factor 3B subunit 3
VFLAVGTAKDLKLKPRSFSAAFIHLYRFVKNNELELVYKVSAFAIHRVRACAETDLRVQTPVEDVPLCLMAFQGRLLAGVGSTLRIYDMGKKKLLRKCENRNFPTSIVSLSSQGDRIYVGSRGIAVLAPP